MKVFVMMMAAVGAMATSAGDSTPFNLDTYVDPTVESSFSVSWDASWIGGNSGATVVIADNGDEVKSATGMGEFLYGSPVIGRHELTYTTYIDGIAQEEFYSVVVFTTALGCSHVTTDANAHVATCTETGYTGDLVCQICGVVVERGATIPALGHEAVETKVAKEATCTESGWMHEVWCSRCNEILEASSSIEALGHYMGEGVVTKPPTTSEDGVVTYCCTRCGIAMKTEVVPKIVIGWAIDADGVLTGVNLNGATEVTIPDTVKSIGDRAFCNCSDLTDVTIPNSVTNIGHGAFNGCGSLKSITLPFVGSKRGNSGTADSLFGYIFGTTSYEGGTKTQQYYTSSNYIEYYIPSTLKSVTITDETVIGYRAFWNCSGLSYVFIPRTLKEMGSQAFKNCKWLRSVNIDSIANWCGINLASAASNPLCYCPGLYLNGELVTDLVIPDGVKSIARYAFRHDGEGGLLERVHFPASVTSIGDEAFSISKINRIKQVVFEGDAPSMGSSCFKGADSNCTVRVNKNSKGWGVTIPGIWNGMRIEYLPIEPLGTDAVPSVVTNAIEAAGFVDTAGVKAAIGGSAKKYAAFKSWAQGVKHPAGTASAATAAGEDAVIANTNAAVAFMLGAERLFKKAPKIEFGEVEVGGGGMGKEGDERAKGTITLTVTVKDGENAVKCVAEKVKEMFEATGDLGDWNGAVKLVPTVSIEDGSGEAMRFNVTPGDGTASKAFLRIKVK